ncbi:myc box-dependent-interacting protein 1-like isoform X2 [Drosophila albomicans]|uniref:Myc box-dependent-interacting protein 1-like isoform X2 n=1 Tax=Drosophila albomicans TaxID=7291 RepID=A0A6P8WV30_DROAB|nr:myc box-dependent-interacting protein 1-like isoform X2 [Drosophila albomicans]
MSENKGIMLAKSMQKHAGRAKEKILQNLGKVDRTADEIFDDHLNNFNRQQTNANKLQKEFNNYIRCIRAAQTASKSLMDAVCEVYEPQWTGYDALQAQTAASESLWLDFAHKLGDQVLIPLNTYTGQFPEMKKKVEKRNRKLIDYDGQRHSFQNLQANANKRKDDVKLTKGREQLEEARRTYEILNTELHDELPALYDSRILFLVTNLQTLFATEQVFHNETAKIYSELEAIVDKLATESQRGSNTLRKQTINPIKTSSPVQSPVNKLNNANANNSNYQNQITTNGGSSLANSQPTPESSQLPELPHSPAPQLEKPSAEEVARAAIEAAVANGITSITTNKVVETTEPSSPNANSVAATATATAATTVKTEETIREVIADAKETTTTTTTTTTTATKTVNGNNNEEEATAAAINNSSSSNSNSLTSAPASSTAKEPGKQPKELPDGQSGANGNSSSLEEHKQKKLDTETVVSSSHQKQLVNNQTVNKHNKNPFDDDDERIYEVPKDANTADLPPGVLYRVKATYGYVKEDVDELSFEIGDTIRVIEYDDPEDQEEGWLMGQKEGTTEKGLFPANFTRPI